MGDSPFEDLPADMRIAWLEEAKGRGADRDTCAYFDWMVAMLRGAADGKTYARFGWGPEAETAVCADGADALADKLADRGGGAFTNGRFFHVLAPGETADTGRGAILARLARRARARAEGFDIDAATAEALDAAAGRIGAEAVVGAVLGDGGPDGKNEWASVGGIRVRMATPAQAGVLGALRGMDAAKADAFGNAFGVLQRAYADAHESGSFDAVAPHGAEMVDVLDAATDAGWAPAGLVAGFMGLAGIPEGREGDAAKALGVLLKTAGKAVGCDGGCNIACFMARILGVSLDAAGGDAGRAWRGIAALGGEDFGGAGP